MEHASLPASPCRWPLTLLVIALHLLLFAALRSGLANRPSADQPETHRMTVLLLPDRRAPVLPEAPVKARRSPEAASRRDVPPMILKADPEPPAAPAIPPAANPAVASAEVPASLALPSPAGSAPPRERLIDGAATRAALRQAAREPTSQERHLAAQGQEMGVSASERLGRQVQRAGHGDCLKGQFAGAGLGLLSAPFYLLAEASGKCAKGTPPPSPPMAPEQEPSGRKGAHASMRDR